MTASQAVRQALKNFDDPDQAPGREVLAATNRILVAAGQEPHKRLNLVHDVRIYINRAMGKPLTAAKIEAYEAQMGRKPKKRGRRRAVPGGYTASMAVRDALKEATDPDTTPTKRLLAIARAKMAQHSGPATVGKDLVNEMRQRLRRKYGRPVTAQKVLAYEQTLRSPVPVPSANGRPAPVVMQAVAQAAAVLAGNAAPSLEDLKGAAAWARERGGLDLAIGLLTTLKDLLP